MKNTEKLIMFMEARKEKIIKIVGVKAGEMFFTNADKQELSELQEGTAKNIYTRIEKLINNNVIGEPWMFFPFCRLEDLKCRDCKYAKRHGGFFCACEDSDYRRLYEMLDGYDKAFPTKFYRKLIEKIEKKEGI